MLTTVSGAVAQPGVYEIEAGSSVGDVLAMAGADMTAQAVLIGGYFGTWHDIAEVAGLPFTIAGLRAVGGAPGAGCPVRAARRGLRTGRGGPDPALPGQPERAAVRAVHVRAAGDRRRPGQLASARPEGDPLGRMQRRFGADSRPRSVPSPGRRGADGRIGAAGVRSDAHAHARRRTVPGLANARRPAAGPVSASTAAGAPAGWPRGSGDER